MAEDDVDMRILGRQVQMPRQGDDSGATDVAATVEITIAGIHARLDRLIETEATNLQILLAAIGKRDG